MKLRTRLTLFGGGVVALALLLFGLLLYALLARSAYSNQDDALKTRAQQAAASLNASPLQTAVPPIAPVDLRTSTDVYLEVFDKDWTLLYSTGQLGGRPPTVGPRIRVTIESLYAPAPVFDTENGFRLCAVEFGGGYVVAGQSTRVPESNRSGIVVFLVISAIPALLAALLASWLVAGRALRPLKLVATQAEDIGRTRDFGRRLPAPRGRDEVALLAASFNGMLGQLQDAFESQKRFLADASHELRTPLTTIQGNAGLLASRDVSEEVRREAAEDVVHESARMGRLVDSLLTLARADSGLELSLAPGELMVVVQEVCRQAGAAHPGHRITVEAAPLSVRGDEDALRQLLWILLDNAFRYAVSEVSVHLYAVSGWARLLVSDDGPGIPSEYREKIFERFYRADSARAGDHAGLGLSIARWIVTQHGGRILAGEAPGGGAAFVVDLPLLPPS